jgi:hypothetical protein
MAFIIQPKEKVVWYCGAHPDEAPYIRIDVEEYFAEERS